MAAIFQTTFSNAFSWMKRYELRLRFHWSFFPMVQLTIIHHWFRKWIGPSQATSHYLIWTNAYPGGGVLPMWWVIHMCHGFDPLFSLWQDRARSFWGTFSHPPTAKLSFGVQKLPIFTKMDLFGPKFNFFLDLFGSNFQRPAAHPHQFSGRIPPPPPPPPPRDAYPVHWCIYVSISLNDLNFWHII